MKNRGSRQVETEIEVSPPLLLLNKNVESKQSANLISESITYKQKSFDLSSLKSTGRMMLLQYHANTEENADEWDGMSRRSSSPRLSSSNWSNKGEVDSLHSTLCPKDEAQEEDSILPSVQKAHDGHHYSPSIIFLDEKNQGLATDGSYDRLEQAIMFTKNSKQDAFEESVKRWQAEDDAMEAIRKAKETETLHTKHMSKRKELEEELARGKEEVERMKNQQDELMKELQMVQDQRSILESRIAESHSSEKELEEKIISAVKLLISIRQKRDELLVEHKDAIREVNELRGSVQEEAASFCTPQFLSFSFMEINEATNNFDPSWKIGEGSYGSVYKGVLRHMHVAIKMLPFYGSQDHLEFQHEVEVSCRVRHPNLMTLIGTCPESRSLIYEYLQNGSLEDRLTCRNRTPPLPWQTRIRIATEICSALIFLHSNKPSIIHGNLKPTKVLLDGNYVCKLGDLDILRIIPPGENMTKTSPKSTSAYMDPEFLETGELAPELDVYSFGIIMMRLLTGRPALGIVNDVKCALENEVFNAVLDFSAGDWPLEQANQLAHLALRCCEKNHFNRPDLASEVWSVLEAMMVSCTASATCLGSRPHRRIPSHFICPIFQEVMKDPHIAADGFTYEADAIKGWLQSGHNTSPMTNLKLSDCNLLPNYALLYAIQEWQQRS